MKCKICGNKVSWFPGPRSKKLCFNCWWDLDDKIEMDKEIKRKKKVDAYYKEKCLKIRN